MNPAVDAALATIDAANAADPNRLGGRPLALVQGERASAWLARLVAGAHVDPALALAVRAHHVRRWTIARDTYPEGRAGYLRWRRDLKAVHADALGELLPPCGIDATTVARAQALVAKRLPLTDPAQQRFEDVVCLVFLETQYEALIDRLDEVRMIAVLRKTLPKMSPAAVALAGSAELHPRGRDLLVKATAPDP